VPISLPESLVVALPPIQSSSSKTFAELTLVNWRRPWGSQRLDFVIQAGFFNFFFVDKISKFCDCRRRATTCHVRQLVTVDFYSVTVNLEIVFNTSDQPVVPRKSVSSRFRMHVLWRKSYLDEIVTTRRQQSSAYSNYYRVRIQFRDQFDMQEKAITTLSFRRQVQNAKWFKREALSLISASIEAVFQRFKKANVWPHTMRL
jgi:hypothetical protein